MGFLARRPKNDGLGRPPSNSAGHSGRTISCTTPAPLARQSRLAPKPAICETSARISDRQVSAMRNGIARLFARDGLLARLEPQAVLLAFVVVGIYFTRLGDLTLRGEETRRARVAIEMIETGDWVVPHEQGRLFPDRPPLGNWLIAVSMLVTGSTGTIAVRLPTVLATLVTTLIVYVYSRSFLSRNGALAAGLAYATMGQVLTLGMLAETEATLTLFVGASLLLWHLAYQRGLAAWKTWCLGYVLAGLAALAKGPQGPIYFSAAAVLYLSVRRDWRFLISWSHAVGLAAGAAVVAAWQVPYSLAVAWPQVLQTWGHTSVARFDYSSIGPVLRHLVTFPCEIFGCLLPWSVWLVAFLNRDFRRTLGPARDAAVFLGIAIAVAFPSCWLAPQARGRYFMPLYPCFAPLIGIVLERAWWSGTGSLAALWRHYCGAAAVGAAAMAVAIMVGSVLSDLPIAVLRQSLPFALGSCVAGVVLSAVLWKARRSPTSRLAVAGLVALSAFLGLMFNGPIMNDAIRRSDDIAAQIAHVKERLPAGVQLVSLGRAHHPFVYHYGQTIPWLDWPQAGALPDYGYFCFHSMRGRRKPLPFEWEEIAVVRCDRYLRANPVDAMIIGRRLPQLGSRSAASDKR
jgi:4-amino-4-deoxy-L-arabinose transferase-like glycosyltransferase